ILDKKIGKIRAATVLYPGQIFNIGTHVFDALRMLIPYKAKAVSGISFDLNNRDPSISGWIEFDGRIPCALVATGRREDLIMEIDIIGDEGRIKLSENGEKVECYSFSESKRYSGYRELTPTSFNLPEPNDSLVTAIREICAALKNKKIEAGCSGGDGLAALVLSCAMIKSAEQNARPVKLEKKYML
ncbi:MAG: Gfo/Idh/MocA family oxidoreductase, partial [Candidatus Omnitrophica bacterium]|nr:Gfo/Idh/MocA family oxidoreductase [Candidatus Omnitrophota bacterium]